MVWIPRRWFSGWVFYQSPSKFASGILGWFYITSSLTHPRPTNTWLICKNTFKGKTHRYITLYWGNMHAAKTFLFNRIPNSTHNQWISSIFALFHHWSYPTTDSRPSTNKNQPAASPAAGRRQAGALRADFPARVSRISTYMALAQNSWPVWNSTGSLLTWSWSKLWVYWPMFEPKP